jgi:hypothetical protein
MMSKILRRLSKLGTLMGYLVASGTGSFAFTNGHRLVAMNEEGSDRKPSMSVGGRPSGGLSGIVAAIFLLLFVVSEAVAAVAALRR